MHEYLPQRQEYTINGHPWDFCLQQGVPHTLLTIKNVLRHLSTQLLRSGRGRAPNYEKLRAPCNSGTAALCAK